MSDQAAPVRGLRNRSTVDPDRSHGERSWAEAIAAARPSGLSGAPRVSGLDGLRGLASLYVVLFHCWLLTQPGFPTNSGPAWLGWVLYGRIAVVFFLALSGFSLALGPASNGWRLGGVTRFLRRRAWRIMPPYWAALAASLAVAYFVIPASHFGPPTGRTVVVYGLALQDVLAAPTPNGAFWSIAVEIELYLLFPLFLAIRRRWGAMCLVAVTTIPVVLFGLRAEHGVPVEGMNWLTSHLLPVFVGGIVGAGIVVATEKVRRLPWLGLAALAALPVVVLVVRHGSAWTVNRFFWIDLAVVPAMTMLLVAVATGRPVRLLRLLATGPLRRLGDISYSLYLTHLMVIMIVARRIAPEYVPPGLGRFWFTLILGLPLSLLAAWLFASLFEIPFKRARSWKALIAAGRSRLVPAGRESD